MNQQPEGRSLLQEVRGAALLDRYRLARKATETLCEPLAADDYVVQPEADVSPAKWHLAHTSWFFEAFLLKPARPGYAEIDPLYHYLFNSYYHGLGEFYPRRQRGDIVRPTVEEVFHYREYVDFEMANLIERIDEGEREDLAWIVTLGINHEQQHQELMLMDIKNVYWHNPIRPAYRTVEPPLAGSAPPVRWKRFPEGLVWIGHDGAGFCYDNELPRHREFVESFELADRPVTNGEFIEFIDDGGYEQTLLWLSDGWDTVSAAGWTAPLYWEKRDGGWRQMTLTGMREVNEAEPVCHVSYYEADAYARWAEARLPTEAEWETAATGLPVDGNFVESGYFHPIPAPPAAGDAPAQLFGDVWEWTRSHYSPYPGFRPASGPFGEYNGKFMCNQMVLRGGCCVTPLSHIRATYRNFFHAGDRWQFGGIRLARDV